MGINGATFIDKIEDLYDKSYIILNIICRILNKNLEEIMNILGATKSSDSLENISSIMNLYFDYNYDYLNKEYLNKNTIFLIQFLKSRYPKKIPFCNNTIWDFTNALCIIRRSYREAKRNVWPLPEH